jgi:hypothetical protein
MHVFKFDFRDGPDLPAGELQDAALSNVFAD